MNDILFKTGDGVFSYRVAGICVQNGKVLLQKATNDPGFAFPGGHAVFGETNAETLIREFKEEIGGDISVGELRWVGEVFFPWGNRPCHQICLYYSVEITDGSTPRDGVFAAKEHIEGRSFDMEFHWVSFNEIPGLEIYPDNCKKFLLSHDGGLRHFIYKE